MYSLKSLSHLKTIRHTPIILPSPFKPLTLKMRAEFDRSAGYNCFHTLWCVGQRCQMMRVAARSPKRDNFDLRWPEAVAESSLHLSNRLSSTRLHCLQLVFADYVSISLCVNSAFSVFSLPGNLALCLSSCLCAAAVSLNPLRTVTKLSLIFFPFPYFFHFFSPQLTPVGLTVFRGIHAIDRDKPNTANSDITYSIVVSHWLHR